jgi:hypothetical protein
MDFMRKLYTTKLENNKNLLEITTYDNISMWWTADVLFYEYITHPGAFKPQKKSFILNILFGNIGIVLKMMFFLGGFMFLIFNLFLVIFLRLVKILSPVNLSKKNNLKKILFISQNRMWNKKLNQDTFFNSLINEVKEKYELGGIYHIDLYPIQSLKILYNKRRYWSINQHSLHDYWSFEAWKKELSAFYYFYDEYKIVLNSDILKKIIQQNNLRYDEVMKHIGIYFLVLFPHSIKTIYLARTLIQREKPNLVLLLNEYYWWERALLFAAKFENVPTLALQHGVFPLGHKGYYFHKNEVSKDLAYHSPLCPIPDKLAVFGTHYRDMLVEKGNYPNTCIVVTGQPRFDFILNLSEVMDKNIICQRYNIPKDKIIILWTTQSLVLTEEEIIKTSHCIFSTIKKINNIFLIIKQHPEETSYHRQLIKNIAKEFEMNNYILLRDVYYYELAYISDILITKFSTTAVEAVLMKKGLIILNLGDPVDNDCVNSGVAMSAYDEKSLLNAINLILIYPNILLANREHYLKTYCYNEDGLSTKRVSKLIKEMVGT